jgi:hypothetical protein
MRTVIVKLFGLTALGPVYGGGHVVSILPAYVDHRVTWNSSHGGFGGFVTPYSLGVIKTMT